MSNHISLNTLKLLMVSQFTYISQAAVVLYFKVCAKSNFIAYSVYKYITFKIFACCPKFFRLFHQKKCQIQNGGLRPSIFPLDSSFFLKVGHIAYQIKALNE